MFSVVENAVVASDISVIAAPAIAEPTATISEIPVVAEEAIPAAAVVNDSRKSVGVADDAQEKNRTKVTSLEAVAVENAPKITKIEFFMGASLMNFGYTEFDTNGAWLDEESGVLPGLLVGGSLHWSKAYASLMMNYNFGEVGYEGQTQSVDPALSGLPINSTSDADIFDTTAIAGYQFSSLHIYGGLGYYYWRRNIRPTTTNSGLPVAGVLEFYSWTYALLGARTELWRNWTSHLELDLRATRMLDANMEVNFLGFGGYDNASLDLGEDWGFRLAVPWTFRYFDKDSSLTIEPYYTSWNLKRSKVSELTIGGVGTGSGVVEPRSETRNFGISVYFRYLM